MAVFKAYDIRGRYPEQIDEEFARRLGAAVTRHLGARTVAVGRDVRRSAPSVAAALAEGIVSAGATAVDLGLVTTPMLYFAVGKYGLDGGVMVTASHNPPEDIGFKLCRERAYPIGESTGLREIRAGMEHPAGPGHGSVEPRDILPDYRLHLRSRIGIAPRLRIAVDAAAGCVAVHFDSLFGDLPGVEWIRLCFRPDGSFPAHLPNPLEDRNVRDLQEEMRRTGADLGVAFDGDGDRCIFFEPGGLRVRCDLVTALLAVAELDRHPGAAVVYDLRSSRVVREAILRAGGQPVRERVGHAFLKATMRQTGAVLAGELSGHYYFRDHYNADSGLLAFAKVLDLLGRGGRTLSDLLAPHRRTHASGEINFHIEDKDAAMRRLRRTFRDGRIDEMDGVTVEYDDWWFNVRPSNTEALLRLNIEADRPERLNEAKDRLLEILGAPV